MNVHGCMEEADQRRHVRLLPWNNGQAHSHALHFAGTMLIRDECLHCRYHPCNKRSTPDFGSQELLQSDDYQAWCDHIPISLKVLHCALPLPCLVCVMMHGGSLVYIPQPSPP